MDKKTFQAKLKKLLKIRAGHLIADGNGVIGDNLSPIIVRPVKNLDILVMPIAGGGGMKKKKFKSKRRRGKKKL